MFTTIFVTIIIAPIRGLITLLKTTHEPPSILEQPRNHGVGFRASTQNSYDSLTDDPRT